MEENMIYIETADEEKRQRILALKLPECLKEKLIFGDSRQIKALRRFEEQAREIEEGELKKYEVRLTINGSIVVYEETYSEELAIEEAERNLSMIDLDEYEIVESEILDEEVIKVKEEEDTQNTQIDLFR